MNGLPTLGVLILTLLVASGYVLSRPDVNAEEARAQSALHLDRHVGYYEQHRIAMGAGRLAR